MRTLDEIRKERGEGVYAVGTRGLTGGVDKAATVNQEVERPDGPVDRARGALDNLVQDYRYHVERVAELDAKLREMASQRDEVSALASQWDLDRHAEQRRADRLQHEMNAVRAEITRLKADLEAEKKANGQLAAREANLHREAVCRAYEARRLRIGMDANLRQMAAQREDALRAKILGVIELVSSPDVDDFLSRSALPWVTRVQEVITDVRNLLDTPYASVNDTPPSPPESA